MNPTWRRSYLRYKSYFLNIIGRYKEREDVKAYLEILLSLITISTFAIFALKPTMLTIASLLKEIDAKEKILVVMNEKIEKLSKAQSLFDRYRDSVTILENAIPQGSDPEVFAQQMEALAGKHRAYLSSLNISNAVIVGSEKAVGQSVKGKAGSFSEDAGALSVSLSVLAADREYPTVLSFLTDFEYLRRPVKVDILNISQKEDKDREGIVSLFIEGRIPYFAEQKPISSK